jgi:aldehyde:ferredoxin oxidoreductase
VISPFLHISNVLGFCLFSLYAGNIPSFTEIIEVLTGKKFSLDEILIVGERILTLRHFFNLREGVLPEDFILPDRVKGIPPHDKGPLKGISIDNTALKMGYFSKLNWDIVTGMPSKEILEDLKLNRAWNDLICYPNEIIEDDEIAFNYNGIEEVI